MALKKNVGFIDRNIRLAVAGVLILIALVIPSMTMKMVLTLIGLVILVTGVVGICPAYIPFKFSTFKDESDQS